ncbi:MAG: hypothetical protein JMDDDDMK_00229 [Acidobacteria bacterium]|nr:hypothetical protein [Acidobacteriota bacterium]
MACGEGKENPVVFLRILEQPINEIGNARANGFVLERDARQRGGDYPAGVAEVRIVAVRAAIFVDVIYERLDRHCAELFEGGGKDFDRSVVIGEIGVLNHLDHQRQRLLIAHRAEDVKGVNDNPVISAGALVPVIFVRQNLAQRRGGVFAAFDQFLRVLHRRVVFLFEEQVNQFRRRHLRIFEHRSLLNFNCVRRAMIPSGGGGCRAYSFNRFVLY